MTMYMVARQGRHGIRLTELRIFTDLEEAKKYMKTSGMWAVIYEVSENTPPKKLHV